MISIERRIKDKVDILNDLRKKNPDTPKDELERQAEEEYQKKLAKIRRKHPRATVIDLTSKSKDYIGPTKADDNAERGIPAVYFSPFYPHRNIPVPGLPGVRATCVEAVWQGLKVFEKNADVDYSTFLNDKMRGIKRTVRRFGTPSGHRLGGRLLKYGQARKLIYLPTYKWMLDNIEEVQTMIGYLRNRVAQGENFVFLDYNTNGDWDDLKSPLSHASLVKAYIEGKYPDDDTPSAQPQKAKPEEPTLPFPDL